MMKYSLLRSILPINIIMCSPEDTSTIDKIMTVVVHYVTAVILLYQVNNFIVCVLYY